MTANSKPQVAERGPAPRRSPAQAPKESRRWLKRQVPKELLYELAPPRPRPKRFRISDGISKWRGYLRAWWLWLSAALVLDLNGYWLAALPVAGVAWLFYYTAADRHPAVYGLSPGFDTRSDEFRETVEGMTGTPLVEGNRVTILENGDGFYPEMLAAVELARQSVTMEQYIFWDGAVGARFAEALAQRARAGVEVKLLLDAIGSAGIGREIFRILEAGGCQLAWFRPIHWYTVTRANHRTHRKSLIVDGCIAFTGGAGIADQWLGMAANAKEWRDIQVKVEGPAALAQQSGFAQNWLEATGEILGGPRYFPAPARKGEVEVQTILSSSYGGASAAGTMYLIALQCARKCLYIANPYFIPDLRTISMLSEACRRGVSVKVMLAGKHNDTWWARQNSVRLYGALLRAGVELYEFQPTMLHQKTMVLDGVWATVGTTNFDNRSFALNEETNVCFHDPALVEKMKDIFLRDLAQCRQIDLEQWLSRGCWQRIQEQIAALIEDQV